MKPIWPALLSFVFGPGMGQLINRDFKKALFLIGVSISAFIWFFVVIYERLMLVLPGTPDQWDPELFAQAFENLKTETPAMFITFKWLMLLLWIYSIADAYSTAKFRMISKIPRRREE